MQKARNKFSASKIWQCKLCKLTLFLLTCVPCLQWLPQPGLLGTWVLSSFQWFWTKQPSKNLSTIMIALSANWLQDGIALHGPNELRSAGCWGQSKPCHSECRDCRWAWRNDGVSTSHTFCRFKKVEDKIGFVNYKHLLSIVADLECGKQTHLDWSSWFCNYRKDWWGHRLVAPVEDTFTRLTHSKSCQKQSPNKSISRSAVDRLYRSIWSWNLLDSPRTPHPKEWYRHVSTISIYIVQPKPVTPLVSIGIGDLQCHSRKVNRPRRLCPSCNLASQIFTNCDSGNFRIVM